MNKQILSLILAGLLIMNLAGCSSSFDGQLKDDNPGATTTEIIAASETAATETDYTGTIFDTSYVHEINVEISEEDWADLLENPTEKTKYNVNVTIDGNDVSEVSFATKGNTSLTQVAFSDSDRYSFKLNFGKFIKGQTYDGLDKLNLNNIYGDATYMKDYLSYRIMAEAGVASSLVSFVSLSINGEKYGLYVAIEEVGDAFLERNYGEDTGELYKPETSRLAGMGVGGMSGGNIPVPGGNMPSSEDNQSETGDGTMSDDDKANMRGNREFPTTTDGEFQTPENREFPAFENGELPSFENGEFPAPENGEFIVPENGEFPGQGGMGGGFGDSSKGAGLVYTDDEISSYSDIFDNAETDAKDEDYQRMITALKQLATGEDLESCVDVKAVLRYFVAHNFVLNYDSYTGNMLHNYYLYENDGILTMLPWDYNLAFGGFNNNTATEDVNWPIDSPLADGVSEDGRPMWSKLVADEEYMELYHSYFDELITNYFESGRFETEVDTLYALIRPYLEVDPTAFYKVEEFDTAVETLKKFCQLRTESIRGQLDGTIPATAAAQQEDSSALIDAGELNIKDMGSMGGMGGGDRNVGPGGGQNGDQNGGQRGGRNGSPGRRPDGDQSNAPAN